MQVLNWLRDGHELKALVLTRSRKGNDLIRVQTLDQLKVQKPPAELIEAWKQLERAEHQEAKLLFALTRVLLSSQTLSWQALNLAEPVLKPIHSQRPTAAHPRAYKGTKTRLPKSERTVTDLRPYLSDMRWVHHLLSSLRNHEAEVLQGLAASGVNLPEDARLENLWRSWQLVLKGQTMPVEHRLALLSCLQEQPVELQDALMAHAASWPKSQLLIPALCRLLQQNQAQELLVHLNVLAEWPPDQVLELLKNLSLIKPLQSDWAPVSEAWMALNQTHNQNTQQSERWDYIQWALEKNLNPAYVRAGLLLAAEFYPSYDFPERHQAADVEFPLEWVQTVARHATSGEEYDWRANQLATQIWVRWAEVPAFVEFFNQHNWLNFTPAVCAALLHLVCMDYQHWWWRHSRSAWAGYSGFLCRMAPDVLLGLAKIPESFQATWLRLLADHVCLHLRTRPYQARRAKQSLQRAMKLFLRFCAEPFKPEQDCALPFLAWIDTLSDTDFEVFLTLPDSVLKRLETLFDADEEREFLNKGVAALLAVLPGLGLEALAKAPARLGGLGLALGMLKNLERQRVVKHLAADPLMQDFSALDVSELCKRLIPLTQGLTSPLPRKLRLWHIAQSAQDLSSGQLERARLKTFENLVLTRLDRLDLLIWEAIFADFPDAGRTEPVRHALMAQKLIDTNRRALRKALRRILAGDRDYLAKHALNQRWLDQHPACNRSAWREGLTYRCNWQETELTLKIETDPFEVLKMGTYVSSCLRLSGSFLFSAVAVLLDINKRVVFARDAKGRVIARQLIAMDEQNRLVGFSVYPLDTPPELEQQFLAHLQQLSQALDLKLYSEAHDQDDSQIELLLAQDWWHDGVWNY